MRHRRDPSSLRTAVLLGGLLSVFGCGQPESAPEQAPAAAPLAPVPHPDLAPLQPSTRARLGRLRKAVDGVAAGDVWGELGRTYLLLEFDAAAVACFDRQLAIDGDDFHAEYYAGVALARLGRPADAATRFAAAARLQPTNVASQLRAGTAFLEAGELELATSAFETARATSPVAAAFGLGQIAERRGDLDAAAELLETAAADLPSGSIAHLALARVVAKLGRDREAAAARERAGTNPIAIAEPAMDALAPLRRTLRSEVVLDLVADLSTPTIEVLDQAVAQLGGDVAALPLLEHSLTGARPDEPTAADAAPGATPERTREARLRRVLSSLNAATGDLEMAIIHARAATALVPGDGGAQVQLGALLGRAGQFAAAAGAYGNALALRPADSEARTGLAAALADEADRLDAAGQLGPARDRYRRAAQTNPQQPMPWLRWLASLDRRGQEQEFAAVLDQALEAAPAAVELRLHRALHLIRRKRFVQVRSALDADAASFQSDALRGLLARVLASAPDARVRDGARAVSLAETLFEGRRTWQRAETLAMALAEAGRIDEAARIQAAIRDDVGAQLPAADRARIETRLTTYLEGRPWRAADAADYLAGP